MTPNTKIGRLTLIEPIEGVKPKRWKVRCECGTVKDVLDSSLRYGRTVSCGCQRRDQKNSLMSGAFQKRRPA